MTTTPHLKKILLILILTLMLPSFGQSQQSRSGKGTAQVRIEDNMTRTEARRKAEEQAKINAISHEYGTYVEQQSEMTVRSGRTEFSIIGNTRVKGEWVKTIDLEFTEESRHEYSPEGKKNITWVTCNIRGTMKKASPKPAIEFDLLNCPDKRCRTTTYHSEEQFYLWFRSPVDGYLSVFMEDDKSINRLLPYIESTASVVTIKADTDYLFFANDPEPVTGARCDWLKVYTTRQKETQRVYLLFSENGYTKPPLQSASMRPDGCWEPASLSKPRFEKWLSENRALLPGFRDDQVLIEIVAGQ